MWQMEAEEIEGVLQKIWDLHDKLSDAIHSISRANFLNSVRSRSNRKAKDGIFVSNKKSNRVSAANGDNDTGVGYVYFEDFSGGLEGDGSASLQEAKSLNSIRSALENLEDQLEFFHTVQIQQQAERDVALARIEQSRIILAMRLAEHQGKKYTVIEEAEAFVGDVHDATHFVLHENIYSPAASHTAGKFAAKRNGRRNAICNLLISTFNFVKKSIKLSCSGIVGNAATVAISMLVLVHLQQVGIRDKYVLELNQSKEDAMCSRNMTKVSKPESSLSGGHSSLLDVLLARG